MSELALRCKTCKKIFFKFDIPFSLSKLYSKKKERRVHLGHRVDVIEVK